MITPGYPPQPHAWAWGMQPGEYEKQLERSALRRRGIGIGLALVAMAVLPYLLSTFGFGLMSLLGFVNGNQYSQEFMYMKPEVYYLYYMVLYLSMVVLPFAVLIPIFHLRGSVAFPARRTARPGLITLACIGGLAVCMCANFLTNQFYSIMQSVFELQDMSGTLPMGDSVLSKVLYFCIFAILPPFAEEFAFRGVAFGLLRPYGKTIAVIGSAFAFAIMHGNMVQIPFAFVGGLFFGYLMAETGSIWPSVFVHFLNNAFSVTQEFLSVGLPGGWGDHALYLSYILITLIGLVCLVVVLRKDRNFFRLEEDCATQLDNRAKFKAFVSNPGMIIAFVVIALEVITSVQFVGW